VEGVIHIGDLGQPWT